MGDIMSRGEEEKQTHPSGVEVVEVVEVVEGEARDISELEGGEEGEEEPVREGDGGEGDEVRREDKEVAVELEEILKTCNQIQSKSKSAAPTDSSESGIGRQDYYVV